MRIFKNAWFQRFAHKKAASHVLGLTDDQLAKLIDKGQFSEVAGNDKKVSE